MSEAPQTPLPGTVRAVEVVRRLRGEGGCPWDREQTLQSLRPFLIEECYELLEAAASGDVGRHRDELADVLLQVLLQSQIRGEEGHFTFDDVARHLAEKLVRRHPHVFGDAQVSGTADVLANWEAIKARERAAPRASSLDGVSYELPALVRAQRIQSRAARVGFDWNAVLDVVAKVREELDETVAAMASEGPARVEEEIGDLLFAVVNLARFRGISAEAALAGTTAKFVRRFESVERRVRAEGREMRDCPMADLDAHWEAVKREERAPSG